MDRNRVKDREARDKRRIVSSVCVHINIGTNELSFSFNNHYRVGLRHWMYKCMCVLEATAVRPDRIGVYQHQWTVSSLSRPSAKPCFIVCGAGGFSCGPTRPCYWAQRGWTVSTSQTTTANKPQRGQHILCLWQFFISVIRKFAHS